MDFYKRLNKKYYHKDPVEHIVGSHIIKVAEYDDLYENQSRFEGTIWKKFKETYQLSCKFYEDLRNIDLTKEIICIWFFRERGDKEAPNDLKLAGKLINYFPNYILITPSKDLRIKERKNFFPRRPCVQIDMNIETYVNIKKEIGV